MYTEIGQHALYNVNLYKITWYSTHLLAHAILVDGPDRRYMGLKELRPRHSLVGCPGDDKPRLAHRAVADDDALDQLLTRQLIVHDGGSQEVSRGDSRHDLVSRRQG